jgi:hypothetical protein
MNSVAQVNNLAQFVQLVSAARNRNNGLSAAVQRNRTASQTPESRAFSNAKPLSGYSFARQPVSPSAVEASVTPNQTRHLGTKFDAYA